MLRTLRRFGNQKCLQCWLGVVYPAVLVTTPVLLFTVALPVPNVPSLSVSESPASKVSKQPSLSASISLASIIPSPSVIGSWVFKHAIVGNRFKVIKQTICS